MKTQATINLSIEGGPVMELTAAQARQVYEALREVFEPCPGDHLARYAQQAKVMKTQATIGLGSL